jgi:hypothetical protein
MAVKFDQQELYRLARLGAATRLEALEQERAAILRNFPNLKSLPGPAGGTRGSETAQGKPRRRRRMSAAARKAVSARMKVYWANRRKAAPKRPDKASR